MTCPECDGEGRIDCPRCADDPNADVSENMVDCPFCDGKGYDDDDEAFHKAEGFDDDDDDYEPARPVEAAFDIDVPAEFLK